MDGEADRDALLGACGTWSDDVSVRVHWHRWHLIGDVLRSEDLATDGRRDERLLRALRERLALEPVVVAPQAARAPDRGRHRLWSGAAAVAAGVVVVIAATLLLRQADTTVDASAPLARAGGVGGPGQAAGAGATNVEPETLVVDGQLIRDARLDRYLAAHRPLGGATALTLPSNFTRDAAVPAAPARPAP
jgi:sigma-E factor negative regulatory protein RseA